MHSTVASGSALLLWRFGCRPAGMFHFTSGRRDFAELADAELNAEVEAIEARGKCAVEVVLPDNSTGEPSCVFIASPAQQCRAWWCLPV